MSLRRLILSILLAGLVLSSTARAQTLIGTVNVGTTPIAAAAT